jgi:hypothetical protein
LENKVFGLFKKKTTSYPADTNWSVHQGNNQGRPMIVRRNDGAKSLKGSAEYSFRVGVATPLHTPDEQGFPGGDESNQLHAIEDALCARLEADQMSLQVLAITTSSMREFVFYTRDPDAALAAIESIRSETKSHELQSYIAKDIKWELYSQFA